MMPELIKVNKKFNDLQVLDHLDIVLPERGIVGLSGPSGCGKTTLLHVLAGLTAPDNGEIIGLKDKKVSLVFQEDRLLPWLTAADNINLIIQDRQQTDFWLEKMKMAEQAGKTPDEMSGGMKRRLALARGLAFGGDIILLDEPFKGMDQKLKQSIYPALRNAGRQALVILVTHDPGEIQQLCEEILLASGPPLQLQMISAEEHAIWHAQE